MLTLMQWIIELTRLSNANIIIDLNCSACTIASYFICFGVELKIIIKSVLRINLNVVYSGSGTSLSPHKHRTVKGFSSSLPDQINTVIGTIFVE
jgi:hypothetical protein